MSEKNAFALKTILLLESKFERTWTIDFDNQDFKNTVDINVENVQADSYLNVFVDVSFNAGVNDDKQVTAYVKMVGVFEVEDTEELKVEQFANANAPAIIFPFIREHLSSLSVKGGISPILLAPVNFVKFSEAKKNANS